MKVYDIHNRVKNLMEFQKSIGNPMTYSQALEIIKYKIEVYEKLRDS